MPRLEDLSEQARQGHLNFPCFDHDDAPFVPLAKPLSAVRLGLVTTAGLHVRGDKPFTSGDESYRVLPLDTPLRDVVMSHTSIGFDRTPFMRDPNATYPVDRLRELVARGELAGLGPNGYSFMGALRSPRKIEQESGPEVGQRLRAEGVDAVLLTPT
jgi:D-proline reductase (dithiol) PrdB